MNIIEESFRGLYPNREYKYDSKIKYSGKFKDYNANVKMYYNNLEFGLSRKWKPISREIKIGLLQELIQSLFGGKKTTINMDLYNKFIKNLHISISKTVSDPMLEESFNRVNEEYFNGLMEMPSLVFGKKSKTNFATYDYQTDTIRFTTLLEKDEEALDYVMYHELLHKKLKFYNKNGKNFHHTAEFRRLEKQFKNQPEMERRLKSLARWRFF